MLHLSLLVEQLIPAGRTNCPCTGLGDKSQPGFSAKLAAEEPLLGQVKGESVSRCGAEGYYHKCRR